MSKDAVSSDSWGQCKKSMWVCLPLLVRAVRRPDSLPPPSLLRAGELWLFELLSFEGISDGRV